MRAFLAAFAMGLALAATTAPAPATATSLLGYKWKARPVVIVARSTADERYRDQVARLRVANAGLGERDMVIVTVTGASDPLRRRLGVAPSGFGVFLVGKDGHVAGRWSAPISAFSLFALIDRMPMRRDEMRRQRGQ